CSRRSPSRTRGYGPILVNLDENVKYRSPGQFVPEDPHEERVLVAAAVIAVLPEPPLVPEADLLVRPDGPRVVVVDPEEHPVQVELPKAPAHERAQGVRAVTVAPEVLPADDDPDFGPAVLPVDDVESGRAHQDPRGRAPGRARDAEGRVDRERLKGGLELQRALEPLLFVDLAHRIEE